MQKTEYFTRFPNEYIQGDIKTKFGVSRKFYITYILIDKYRSYEDYSWITIRKVLEFILALLNFLFHFKPVPDETPPISPESFPLPDYQDLEKRNEPLFETVC